MTYDRWEGAPCIGAADLWWPDENGTYLDPDTAIRTCITECPHSTACYLEGVAAQATAGIWGGVRFADGRSIRRSQLTQTQPKGPTP